MIKDYNEAVELIKTAIEHIRSLEHEERSDYYQYGTRNALDLTLSEWLEERIDDSLFKDLKKLSKDVGAEIITWASVDHEAVFDGIGNFQVNEYQTVIVFKGNPEEIYEEVVSGIKGQMWHLNKKKHQKVMMTVHPEEARYILDRKEQIESELNIKNIEYWRMKDEGPEVIPTLFWDFKKD